jgi:hypothetical protein
MLRAAIWLPTLLYAVEIGNDIAVECGERKIEVRLDKSYLHSKKVHVTDKAQLHMSENQTSCEPIEEDESYKFVIFAPFDSCYTRVEHETEDYVYSNEIFYNNGRNKIMIFKWRCIYEDKYTVSYEHAITPIKRTLSFVTEKGEFDVAMKVYSDESFTPASEVNERTPIKLNTPVYVSLDLNRPFAWQNIVLSIRNCFATDQTQSSVETDNWYSLISGMCVQPQDDSVVMLENGMGTNARFKFNMFKWRTKTSYIYMHCEVYLCDVEKEECSRSDDTICTGADRVRRSAPEINEPADGEVLTEFKPTFMSKGPIIIDEVKIVGKGEIEALEVQLYDNEFLRLYIIVTICVVLAFVGILVGIIAVVIRRRNQQQKELFVN